MANTMKIKRTMLAHKIPDEIMEELDFGQEPGTNPIEIISLIRQMDELLTPEQCISIMQEQGCTKTGQGDKAHRAFGRKHKDKTVEERINLFDELDTPHKAPCHINPDGTLSVYWGFGEEGNYRCVCGIPKKLPVTVEVPKTFCACCGAHIRHNYQNSLGVKLRLKEVVSSAVASKGEKRCEFIFDLID
jgi:hypothetical protein